MAYKEVFYELINNAIVHNNGVAWGGSALDNISERTNEEDSSMDLGLLSKEEMDQLYLKNIIMSH